MAVRPSDLPMYAESDRARLEEDFAYYLDQGAEHLQARRLEDARIALERAFQISPYSPKAQNLLGLCYFKLGLLEAARSIYDRLVVDHPTEAPLWLNLGLVLLRQGRLREAERALRRAIQLQPLHTRAHAYLGLVLYRRGDLELAREHFVRARAEDLIRKVDARLASTPETSNAEQLRNVGIDGASALSERLTPFRPLDSVEDAKVVRDEEAWEAVVTHSQTPGRASPSSSLLPGWAVESDLPTPSLEPVPALPTAPPFRIPAAKTADLMRRAPFDDETPEMYSSPLVDSVPFGVTERVPAADGLPELVMWSPPRGDAFDQGFDAEVSGFEAGPGARGRLGVISHAYLRSSAIVAATGALSMKDARGGSGTPLGTRADPLFLLEGQASVLVRVAHLAVALRGVGDLHVVESCLAGFDDGFEWERSRVLNLDVVSLKGRGSVLLDAPGAPLLMPVVPDTSVHAAEGVLLAWSEGVRPAAVDVASEGRLLRLRGSGYVLVAFPPEEPSRGPEKAE